MTQEQIIEGNKLIAEFLGEVREVWKVNDQSTLGWFGETALKYRREIMRMTIGNAILLEHLQFHSSWDWLMPLVEIIDEMDIEGYEGEVGFIISPSLCDLYNDGDDLIIAGTTQKTLILSVWDTVVKSIQWIKSLKETTSTQDH
jgi:hypothetical protein